MNYLAHIYLSSEEEEILLGNFLADMLKKEDYTILPSSWLKGVQFHRRIDSYTDNHPVFLETVSLLREAHSKYATVLGDIFYDYFLIKNWALFSQESFEVFRDRKYDQLRKHLSQIPPRLQKRTSDMIKGDWLDTYSSIEGIDFVVSKLVKRVSKPELVESATDTLRLHESTLNEHFKSFFPDILNQQPIWISELTTYPSK